jgi:1,4-dihydroxy-2-naphthoyl-CoA synthase
MPNAKAISPDSRGKKAEIGALYFGQMNYAFCSGGDEQMKKGGNGKNGEEKRNALKKGEGPKTLSRANDIFVPKK